MCIYACISTCVFPCSRMYVFAYIYVYTYYFFTLPFYNYILGNFSYHHIDLYLNVLHGYITLNFMAVPQFNESFVDIFKSFFFLNKIPFFETSSCCLVNLALDS
jgi:hypothetical protein